MTKHLLYLAATALAISAVAVSQTATPVSGTIGSTTSPPVQAPPKIPTGAAGASGATGASGAIGATGASGKSQNALGLEVEHVRINDLVAIPSVITRPVGPFYLYITNGAVTTNLSLTFDSTTAAAQQTASIASTLNLPYIGNTKHVIGLFSAPVGTYQLKSQPSGKVLLTINIQSAAGAK